MESIPNTPGSDSLDLGGKDYFQLSDTDLRTSDNLNGSKSGHGSSGNISESWDKRKRHSTATSSKSMWSTKSFRAGGHKYDPDIREYDLLSDIGGVDDLSYLYLARYAPTGELVALKFTDLTISTDYELIEELTRTVYHTTILKHPNILPYFTSFVENERLWTVTLAMTAGSARGIAKGYFPTGFTEPVVATILKDVLKGMVYMHESGFIHNDIRGDNILMDLNGHVRITGLRSMMSLNPSGQNLKSIFSKIGENLEWTAPEIISQNSNHTEKSDIYSFGITALELAFNSTPFDDWAPLKILLSKSKYHCPPIDKLKLDKKMSKSFWRMVNWCIQKDPDQRPLAKELLDHSFFKQSKTHHFVETNVMKKSGLFKKHDAALSADNSRTSKVSELPISQSMSINTSSPELLPESQRGS